MPPLHLIVYSVYRSIIVVLLIGILLTWIPNINWHAQPFSGIRAFCDMFFAPFRRFIPPLGGLDISPIFAFIFLQIVGEGLIRVLIHFGL